MLDDFNRLQERTGELGNHHRKYLHYIFETKDLLLERLEGSGQIDEVHLWSAAPDIEAEMDTVFNVGRTRDEKLSFLGCYFAFRLLHLNIRAVDILRLGLSSRTDRYRLYRDFMFQMGISLRKLISAYMEKLLDLFLPPAERPKFVICSVGTRADQDDLDLGIVDDGSSKRVAFNRALGRMQREMLRRAVPLHFYLSEHVGEQSFSASIAEYVGLLEREIQDFIIITEMLGAQPILGSRDLFKQFTGEVTDRYFFHSGEDNRYHEGYLRGMLGEVRSLLMWQLDSDSIKPKSDALRLIKGIVYARKTVFGLEEVNAWDILHVLMEKDPRYQDVYASLERSLSFIEVLRFLYQLMQVQEEVIYLEDENARAQLETVAELMGYRDIGVVRAYDHLLIHYHEHVQAARRMATVLMEDLRIHLEQISVFTGMVRTRGILRVSDSGEENLAIAFVTALRFFRGTRYWDDILDQLEGQDTELLRRFVEDFNALEPEKRAQWIGRYAKWGEVTCLPLFRLIDILYRNRRKLESQSLYQDLGGVFLRRFGACADMIPRITTIFQHYPRLINSFLLALRGEDQLHLMKLLEGKRVWTEEVEQQRVKLVHFCRLHRGTSHYFKRVYLRIIERNAEYVQHFNETERLEIIANGIFARIENVQTISQKKKQLGEYYDLEFLRIGLECMQGAAPEKTDTEFTEFSDRYLHVLFDACKQEVARDFGGRVPTRDLLAIYSAGGHGRKLAFDDDFDLIVMLNSDDERILEFCCRIIARMNRQIIRRGTMTHYRFAEHFGRYVTTFNEFRQFFTTPNEYAFIDMSQLMSARRIVGSNNFSRALKREIIEPFIFSRKEEYMGQIAAEIRSRHEAVERGIISPFNVKETIGGLRDIELLLMILLARFELWQPVSLELFEPLVALLPDKEEQLGRLFEAFSYLKRRRDLYRLTVAAEDELILEEIGQMASILGYCDDPDDTAGCSRLVEEYRATTADIGKIVGCFLCEMGL